MSLFVLSFSTVDNIPSMANEVKSWWHFPPSCGSGFFSGVDETSTLVLILLLGDVMILGDDDVGCSRWILLHIPPRMRIMSMVDCCIRPITTAGASNQRDLYFKSMITNEAPMNTNDFQQEYRVDINSKKTLWPLLHAIHCPLYGIPIIRGASYGSDYNRQNGILRFEWRCSLISMKISQEEIIIGSGPCGVRGSVQQSIPLFSWVVPLFCITSMK